MSTQVITVPVGAPQVVSVNQPNGFGSVCAQPAATGSVLLEYSFDGVNYTADSRGAQTVAIALGQGTFGGGQFTKVRCTATTASAVLLAMDLGQVTGGVQFDRQVLCQSGVAMATPNATAEGSIWAMRLPAGLLKANFLLEIDAMFTATNNANVKTIKAYAGNTGSTTAFSTVVLTSASGGRLSCRIAGRNDGATLIGSSIGSALGFGISTTANVTISSNATYQTTEQEIQLTSTKATGTDSVILDAITVRLYQ